WMSVAPSVVRPAWTGLAGASDADARRLAVPRWDILGSAADLGEGRERRLVGQAGGRHRVREQAGHPDAAADGDAPEDGIPTPVGQSPDAAGEDVEDDEHADRTGQELGDGAVDEEVHDREVHGAEQRALDG